jgi:hypothetical protein
MAAWAGQMTQIKQANPATGTSHRWRLAQGSRQAAGRRGWSAVPEIERQSFRRLHQVTGGAGEFRVSSGKLNKDYSIDIQGRTTTDSMYDLAAGPKPADVVATPVPDENLQDNGVPGVVSATPKLADYGTFALDQMEVLPDASGNANIVGAHEVTLALYYVDELATDLWASLDAAVDRDTDPLSVSCTVNPTTSRVFRVGDFVVFNDEAADPDTPGRRSYECGQIVGPGNTGDVVPTGILQFQRHWAGEPVDWASFETLRCPHAKGIRFFRLDYKIFTYSVKKGFFRTPGLPARVRPSSPAPASWRQWWAWQTISAAGRSRCFRSRTTTSLSCPATAPAPAGLTRSRFRDPLPSPKTWRSRHPTRTPTTSW